jgi:hypothetical protein
VGILHLDRGYQHSGWNGAQGVFLSERHIQGPGPGYPLYVFRYSPRSSVVVVRLNVLNSLKTNMFCVSFDGWNELRMLVRHNLLNPLTE